MALSPSSPVAILNIFELVLTIIIVGLVAGVQCLADEIYRIQFISAVVFGYLIIDLTVATAIFVKDNLDRNLRLLTAGLGFILWLCASALILESADVRLCSWGGQSYDQAIAAGILGLASSVTRAVDAFFVFRSFES